MNNPLNLNIQDTFNVELPADPIKENTMRQVSKACYSFVKPTRTADPKIISVCPEMVKALGINSAEVESDFFRNVFTGNEVLPDTNPYAMCYGGHQFGNWAGQLGDGRAINLAEVVHNDKRWALQLKGAGQTPYSRRADGLAVLRSSIREYLCSEAMFHLGVPTTRALSLGLTGDEVLRDMMYDGNAAYEKGAVVCRVAPSFLRFGNYEIFTARQDKETLKTLVDYTLKHFYPELGEPSVETYIAFFALVSQRTMKMVIDWQRVGFVHGVMNTDNFSILGLTIDYGPYGWLEGYDHGWTPNTTDGQQKRYRYGNQPNIALWNLVQLANALYPLIEIVEPLEAILENAQKRFVQDYTLMFKSKLGLETGGEEDHVLANELQQILHLTETDMTMFFRNLSNVSKETDTENVTAMELLNPVMDAFYKPEELEGTVLEQWGDWMKKYITRLKKEEKTDTDRKQAMNAVNPKYVLRNYMAQLAIDKADEGNYELIEEFLDLLRKPYDEQPESEKWFAKRPDWARDKVGCSMLSCSS